MKKIIQIIGMLILISFVGCQGLRGLCILAVKTGYVTRDGKFTQKWGKLFDNKFSNLSELNKKKLLKTHNIKLPDSTKLMKVITEDSGLQLILQLEQMQTQLNLFKIKSSQNKYEIEELIKKAQEITPDKIDYFEPISLIVLDKTIELQSVKIVSSMFGKSVSYTALVGYVEVDNFKYQFVSSAGPGAQDPSSMHVESFLNEFFKLQNNNT